MPDFADEPADPSDWRGDTGGPRPPEAYIPPSAQSGNPSGPWRPARRVTGRILPASREDRVLKVLLIEPQAWDRLGTEEHELLLGLPAPHGPLFAWLESQLHEHGPQPWAALREGLRGHAHEHHAVALLAQLLEGVESDWGEIKGILAQLVELRQAKELTDLAARAATDPAAFERYRELSEVQRLRKSR